MVIIDEAHHVRNPETKAYQCVQRLVDASEAVVMLSATPIQTGSTDLFTLVSLLRDDLVLDKEDFAAMLEPNEHLYLASEAARGATAGWQEQAATHLRTALATTWGHDVLNLDPRVAELQGLLDQEFIQDRDRVRSVRLIESLNTFSEVVTRTRRRDIGEFTTRLPHSPEVGFTDDQQQVYDATIALGARIAAARTPGMPLKFLLSALLRQAASSITGLAPLIEDLFANRLRTAEMSGEDEELAIGAAQLDAFREEAKVLAAQAQRLIGGPDPKVEQLRRIVEDKAVDDNNKVLVFSTFRHTIAYLEERCSDWGARVAVMHGGVPDDQRKEIRSRFRLDRSDPKAYDVLLCSEVGTEGLDYQFCNTMVNYDIPWNPMRIEQRIGRIDRRGQQSESVAIINLLTKGTIEAEIYERCLSRIGVFNHALGGSEKILGEITEAIVDIATNLAMSESDRAAALRQLADNKIARIEEEQRLEDQQADLFGYVGNAFGESLAEASSEWLTNGKIAGLVRRYFDQIQPGRAIALRPGRVATVPLNADAAAQILDDLTTARLDAVRFKRRLRGDKVVLSLTTDPELAQESDQIELLGPTHPLVKVAAHHSRFNGPREVSLRVTSSDVPPGKYAIGVYSWTRLGVHDALTLRFVADDTHVEKHAAALVSEASGAPAGLHLSQKDRELLDLRHTDLWDAARATHRAQHQESVERRIAALSAQKTRRVTAAQRRLDAATHPDIASMRHSELMSAQASFDRLMADQHAARGRADVKITHIANVSLEVVAH